MDTLLAICAVLCGILGLLGAILPILPGTVLSFVGMLCAYFTTTSALSEAQLWLWGAVAGEMLNQKQPLDKAIVVGAGSLLSFFVGTGIKLIAGGFMMYYIWADVIMLIKQAL